MSSVFANFIFFFFWAKFMSFLSNLFFIDTVFENRFSTNSKIKVSFRWLEKIFEASHERGESSKYMSVKRGGEKCRTLIRQGKPCAFRLNRRTFMLCYWTVITWLTDCHAHACLPNVVSAFFAAPINKEREPNGVRQIRSLLNSFDVT